MHMLVRGDRLSSILPEALELKGLQSVTSFDFEVGGA